MAELTDDDKILIVTRLAHYRRPTDIQAELREAGVDCELSQIGNYDPTKAYCRAAPKWRELFHEEREAFQAGLRDIPIANQRFRMQALQESYEHATKTKNRMLANATLRQAAEEMGGALTNERNVKVERKGAEELTPEERRQMLAEVIRKTMATMAGDPANAQPAPPSVQ